MLHVQGTRLPRIGALWQCLHAQNRTTTYDWERDHCNILHLNIPISTLLRRFKDGDMWFADRLAESVWYTRNLSLTHTHTHFLSLCVLFTWSSKSSKSPRRLVIAFFHSTFRGREEVLTDALVLCRSSASCQPNGQHGPTDCCRLNRHANSYRVENDELVSEYSWQRVSPHRW